MAIETILMYDAPWYRSIYACMHGQPASSAWMRASLALLWLAAQLYRGVVRGRQASYAYGVRRRQQLPCRVISIGNLTLGGTGKTPLTAWLARWCQQQGWRVAILSRGYGAQPPPRCRVVSSGKGPVMPWRSSGDEPYLLARALPGIPVLIGRDRYRTGRFACTTFGSQVVILDDGFQHYALQRDVDLVLLDASNPFGHGSLFPRGILREPLAALQRADAIILTRTDMATTPLPTLHRRIRCWNMHQPIYHMTTVAEALSRNAVRIPEGPAWLRRRRVVAFAGIGNPQAFTTTLTQLGSEVVALMVFPDHHPYRREDWQAIIYQARRREAECLVTTEKDAVRLPPDWPTPMPLYTLHIGVKLLPGEGSLPHQLQALMSHAQMPR